MAMLRSSQGRDVSGEMEQILLAVRSMDRMLSQLCDGQERSARTRFHRDMLTRELLAVAGEKAREKDQLLSVDLTALGDRVYVADYAALMNAGKGSQPLRKYKDTYWAYSYRAQ
jgi:hypothetical protein